LKLTPFSLQLADGSKKHPLGIMQDVPIQVGNFCVLNDFVVVGIAREAYTQIILGRPFFTTFGCKTDVKGVRLTFDVGTCHVEFNFFKD